MSADAHRFGWAGAVLGAVVAGALTGAAAERRVVRARRLRPAQSAAEQVRARRITRTETVTASDGVPLHVEEVGAAEAPLTVVFVHGFMLSSECWLFQRRDLTDLGRLVFYDQRSHGRSGHSEAARCTVDQLGEDLERVLTERVPRGPVVLVGHSMGGMTVMALADRHPELFAERVIAVALLSTSAGKLATLTLGLPAVVGRGLQHFLPRLSVGVGRHPAVLERSRRSGSDISYLLARRFSFASAVDPELVELVERMTAATSVEVVTAFLPTFLRHDKLQALAVLQEHDIETLVLVGDSDLQTPEAHSRAIADGVVSARLVVVPDTGHLVLLERPERVAEELRGLVGRALRRDATASAEAGPLASECGRSARPAARG